MAVILQSTMIFALIGLFIGFVSSFGKLSMKLLHFENQNGKLPNGVCCDDKKPGTDICNGCEYYFIICLSGPTGGPCSIKKIWTEELGFTNYFVFPASFYTIPDDSIVKNPMTFLFYRWQGLLSLKFSVFDNDDGNDEYGHPTNDFVATLEQKNVSLPAYSQDYLITKRLLLVGKSRDGVTPKMTVEISVTCDNGYLIPACTDYCTDKDDDTGHYVCNFMNGTRDCLPGWYGEKCLERKQACVPRDDSFGHYSCDSDTGKKICLPGWEDVSNNCTIAIFMTSSVPPRKTIKSSKVSQSKEQTKTSFTVLPSPKFTNSMTTVIPSSNKTTVIPSSNITTVIPSSNMAMMIPSSSAIPKPMSTVIQESMKIRHTSVASYQQSAIHGVLTSVYETQKLESSIVITASPVVAVKMVVQHTFTVTMKGSSKVSNSSISIAEKEICQSLRNQYFHSDVLCTFSDSNDPIPPNNVQSVFFKMADSAPGIFNLDVTVSDKQSDDKNAKDSMEKAIWVANDGIARKTNLKLAEVTRYAAISPRHSNIMLTTENFTPKSSVPSPNINKESKKKATFDVTRFGGIIAALFVLLTLLFTITVLVSRKNRLRKVQPFKQSKAQNAGASQVFSSRKSLRSAHSVKEVIEKQNHPEIKRQNSDNLISPDVNSSHSPQHLELPMENKHAETQFHSTITELRPAKVNYHDNFIPPALEYVKKKAVAL